MCSPGSNSPSLKQGGKGSGFRISTTTIPSSLVLCSTSYNSCINLQLWAREYGQPKSSFSVFQLTTIGSFIAWPRHPATNGFMISLLEFHLVQEVIRSVRVACRQVRKPLARSHAESPASSVPILMRWGLSFTRMRQSFGICAANPTRCSVWQTTSARFVKRSFRATNAGSWICGAQAPSKREPATFIRLRLPARWQTPSTSRASCKTPISHGGSLWCVKSTLLVAAGGGLSARTNDGQKVGICSRQSWHELAAPTLSS